MTLTIVVHHPPTARTQSVQMISWLRSCRADTGTAVDDVLEDASKADRRRRPIIWPTDKDELGLATDLFVSNLKSVATPMWATVNADPSSLPPGHAATHEGRVERALDKLATIRVRSKMFM